MLEKWHYVSAQKPPLAALAKIMFPLRLSRFRGGACSAVQFKCGIRLENVYQLENTAFGLAGLGKFLIVLVADGPICTPLKVIK